jgi:hypothetical protein
MMGQRLKDASFMWTGKIAEGRKHLDQAIVLCNRANGSLATHIGKDYCVAALAERSFSLWLLGYPEARGSNLIPASSASRLTAGAFGFFTFSQQSARLEPSRAKVSERCARVGLSRVDRAGGVGAPLSCALPPRPPHGQ